MPPADVPPDTVTAAPFELLLALPAISCMAPSEFTETVVRFKIITVVATPF
jgi:hypothetical protein